MFGTVSKHLTAKQIQAWSPCIGGERTPSETHVFLAIFWDPITPFVRIARDEFEVCQHRFVDVFSPQVFLVTCFVPPDLLSYSCGKQQRKNGHQWCWHPKPKEDAVGQHLPKSLELPQAKGMGKMWEKIGSWFTWIGWFLRIAPWDSSWIHHSNFIFTTELEFNGSVVIADDGPVP